MQKRNLGMKAAVAPIHRVASEGHHSAVENLMAVESQRDGSERLGQTTLHRAAQVPHIPPRRVWSCLKWTALYNQTLLCGMPVLSMDAECTRWRTQEGNDAAISVRMQTGGQPPRPSFPEHNAACDFDLKLAARPPPHAHLPR